MHHYLSSLIALTHGKKQEISELVGYRKSLVSRHVTELDDEIDRNMKDDEKKACSAIWDITGVAEANSRAIISVIGADISRFPTDAHISSWTGSGSGNNESVGKRHCGKTRKGNALLRSTLVICGHLVVKNKNSFFHARF